MISDLLMQEASAILAVKTGSIALQKCFYFIFFILFDIEGIFFGSSFFFNIRLKYLMGHAVLNFLIFLQVFE